MTYFSERAYGPKLLIWSNMLLSILLALTLLVPSLFFSSLVLWVIVLVAYCTEHGLLRSLYCFVLANVSVNLALSAFNIQYSYLYSERYLDYYLDSYFFESIFWLFFVYMGAIFYRKSSFSSIDGLDFAQRSTTLLIATSIAMLGIEVVLSSSGFFVPYAQSSAGGTVLFEIACLVLGFAISTTSLGRGVRKYFLFSFAVLLALFVSVGLGKRLPLAYIVIAIFIRIYEFRSIPFAKFFAFFAMLGVVCAGFFWGVFRDALSLDTFSQELLAKNLASTNQGGSFHAASVYVRAAREGLLDVNNRLLSFGFAFFSASLFPMSFLPAEGNLHHYIQQYYDIQGNGGNIGSYSYFFLGYLGPVIFACFLAFFFSIRSSSKVIFCLQYLVVLTSPRWSLYNIGAVVRLLLYSLAIFCIVDYLYILLNHLKKTTSLKSQGHLDKCVH